MFDAVTGKMRGMMKNAIQVALRKRGLRLTHDREDNWIPEINLLEVLVRWRFADHPPRAAVQVGANDGQSEDPLRPLIERYRMRAVLIEPLPEPYEKLSAAYARNELVQTIQAAIDTTSGERDIWRVLPSHQRLPDCSPISSFNRAIIEKHHHRYTAGGGRLTRTRINTLSVRDLLRQCDLSDSIDILQVDTEGYDAVIVNEFLNAGVRPTLINYEHIHLSGKADAYCRVNLQTHGYRLLRYGRDTAAILPPREADETATAEVSDRSMACTS